MTNELMQFIDEINAAEEVTLKNDIVISSGLSLVPNEMETPDEEYDRLLEEFGLGAILNESAMYRVFRMKQSGFWAEIKDKFTGQYKFATWEEFIKDVAELTQKSRQTLFDRVKTYQQLSALGYSSEEMIQKMTESPGLYSRALRLLCDYDVRTDSIVSVNYTKEEVDPEDALDDIRSIITDLEAYGSTKDALNYVRSEILLEPVVSVFLNELNKIVVSWFIIDDKDTGIATTGSIEFSPAQKIPDWLLEEIQKKIR